MKVKSLSRVRLFATPWTVARQAPLSMGFSRQEYWSGLAFPSPGDLPNPGIEPGSPALQADALSSEPPGKFSSLEKCKSKLQWAITSHWSEWPSTKSVQTKNAGEGVEKREHSCTLGGNVNWYSHNGRQYGDYIKIKNTTTVWPSNPLGIYLRKLKLKKKHVPPNVHCSAVYHS